MILAIQKSIKKSMRKKGPEKRRHREKTRIFQHGRGAKKTHLSRVLLRRVPQKDTCRRTPQRGRVCEWWSAREPNPSTPREPPARGGFCRFLAVSKNRSFFDSVFGASKNRKDRPVEHQRVAKPDPIPHPGCQKHENWI